MKKCYLVFLLLPFLSSCFLLGISMKVKNPGNAGKYPRFSEQTVLLGNLNTKYRTCFDAAFYRIDLTVDEKEKYLRGKVEMIATATRDFDTLQIDLYENMKVNSINASAMKSRHENTAAPSANYKRKHGAIFIALKQKAGELFKVVIDYEGKPVEAKKPPWRGGFVWKQDKEKNPWIGVACESEGASIWWPCKDVTNDEPDSVALNITCAKNLTAVANGQFRGKEEKENHATYKWMATYPVNLYDVSIYIGKFSLLSDSYKMPSGKTLAINHYVLSYNYEIAKLHFEQAKKQLAFFEKTFGEYPWYRDGYKLVESPYEGMEHQTAIAYGARYKNSADGFDYIILHESAHEWWGNALTASDLADVWLQEGFATYAEALYVENIKGKNAYLNYLFIYRIFIKNKWPVVGPENRRYFYYKNSDCYQKGAWALHTLRTQINNDTLFFDIIKSFFEKYKYKTTSTADFIQMVNEKTNSDYGWFFKQYLYKREAPILEYYWDGSKFYYRWDGVDADFKMPVDIMLDNIVKISVTPKKSEQSVQVISVSNQTYKKITFDNYTRLFGVKENKKLRKMNVIQE